MSFLGVQIPPCHAGSGWGIPWLGWDGEGAWMHSSLARSGWGTLQPGQVEVPPPCRLYLDIYMPRAVCLLWFPLGGVSCFKYIFSCITNVNSVSATGDTLALA